jgi:UDP-N-acetylglucosamine 2-epimerase (non-hydrolysing)
VKIIGEYGFKVPEGVRLIEPLGYLESLQLESGSKLILTDSKGMQKNPEFSKFPA